LATRGCDPDDRDEGDERTPAPGTTAGTPPGPTVLHWLLLCRCGAMFVLCDVGAIVADTTECHKLDTLGVTWCDLV
jgi:hypothetical protein